MSLINLKARKRELRIYYKHVRENCPPELKKRLDSALTESFLGLEEYRKCGVLFAYISSPLECGTREIIKQAFADGKRIAVPKCVNNMGEMDFYFISSCADLVPGMFGIQEPDVKKCPRVEEFSDGLCLLPGLAYDLQGYRLGFGKGYYDRFLEKFGGVTAGICYSKCVLGELPRGAYDKPADILITEKFINRTGK